MQVRSLGQENSLQEGMEIHSSIFAWRIPWTEEPNGLQSIGSQKVRKCCVHSPYLVCFRILSCVCLHLLAKMDFTEKVYG